MFCPTGEERLTRLSAYYLSSLYLALFSLEKTKQGNGTRPSERLIGLLGVKAGRWFWLREGGGGAD
jgi:hypothetical protein